MPNSPEYGIMYISNEQCQNRNNKIACLQSTFSLALILIERLPGSPEICDFLDVYEIRAPRVRKPEVFRTFTERIAINDKGRHLEGNIWTSRLR